MMLVRSFGLVGLITLRQLRSKRPAGTEFAVRIGRGRVFHLRAGTKDKAVFKQHFMDRELFRVPRHPNPDVIIDLGAHVGIASEVFRRQHPKARIFSVEMDRDNFQLCERNHRSTQRQTSLHAAIWSSSGFVHVVDAKNGNWGYRAEAALSDNGPPEDSRGVVQALSFKDLLGRFGVTHVSVLKIDIEGGEGELLESSWREIFAVTDLIFVEIHGGVSDSASRVEKSLADAQEEFDLGISQAGEFTVIRPVRKEKTITGFKSQAVKA